MRTVKKETVEYPAGYDVYHFTEDGYTVQLVISKWRVALTVYNDFGETIKGITLVGDAISNVLGPRWQKLKPLTIARRLYCAIDPTG